MAYTKDLGDCEAYFTPTKHLQAATFAGHDPGEREAAFAQAKRELELHLGRLLVDPDSDWTDGPRDDYAHFEQTLHLLELSKRQRAGATPTAHDLRKKDARESERAEPGIAKMAQRWLGQNRILAVRG